MIRRIKISSYGNKIFSSVEGLEGADLRQVATFLLNFDNKLGDLYRMTTKHGHVKWVCRDHYRAGYQETHTQKLRKVIELEGGRFDEQLGKVEIILKSGSVATEFYDAMTKAKGVLELITDLSWECTRSDLEELEDALKKSRVSVLRLDLRQFRTGLSSKLLSTSAQYKALLHIRELPNMQMVHFVLKKEFVKLLGFQSKGPPSPLCKLSLEFVNGSIWGKELGRLAQTLKTNSTLTILNLRANSIGSNGAQALSTALKANSTLTTLSLQDNSIGDNGAQALSEAPKTNSTLTTLNLRDNSIGSNGAQALSRHSRPTRL